MIDKITKLITDKKYRFNVLLRHGFYNKWSDERFLKKIYKIRMGESLNLECPVTFNEKLQWLKLHDRNPLYTKMVDKYEFKNYIKERFGEGYTIPTLGVWDSFDDIDFSSLPDKFVLKCTHDSGGLVICKDKENFDVDKAREKINNALKSDYYLTSREWPYKNVKRRVIAEKYMEEDESGVLTDYKVFCFNGVPKIVYISKDKAENPTTDFFDENFNHLEMRMRDPNSKTVPKKPKFYDEMLDIARKLSANIPHVRVDFYYINNKIYVGELTFFHCGGLQRIEPKSWEKKMGEWIDISMI